MSHGVYFNRAYASAPISNVSLVEHINVHCSARELSAGHAGLPACKNQHLI